jgi:hypothetical protein
LAEQRAVLRASAMARQGDPGGGAAILADMKTPKAMAARAKILEDAKDWAAAAKTWSAYAELTVPGGGVLDEAATRTLLRLATTTARAGDEPGLAALRQKYADRIGAGPPADMFRLLTAEPIRTVSDIGRSKQEVNLAESLAANLKALQEGKLTR